MILLTTLFCFLMVGCEKGFVGMGGQVTYSDDGSPLETGTVTFVSETFQARGDIKENGKYVIGSFSEKDGLPPGNYQIFISNAEIYEKTGGESQGKTIPLIDGKYNRPETSEMTLNVDGSVKRFDFKVDRAGKSKR